MPVSTGHNLKISCGPAVFDPRPGMVNQSGNSEYCI